MPAHSQAGVAEGFASAPSPSVWLITRITVTLTQKDIGMSFRFEPSVWLGLTRTLIYTAGLFGWWGVDTWTDEQRVGAVMLVEAVTGTIQRSLVTPNAKISE